MIFKLVPAAAVAAAAIFVSQADKSAPSDNWKGWEFLIGDWVAQGGGKPGDATSGSFSFTRELDGKVLVRKNRAEYPAANGRPASKHEDLMVIFKDNKGTKATYFDNEGHVINYEVTIAADGKTIAFVSDASAPGPKFRLVYSAQADGTLKGSFDMGAPGNELTPYTTWTAKKK
ncbi:MAG: PD40 domain-containing protein [Planctomycetes bacterium]|nr:PD40 domain-containing protein [Planctomycetota bacterium]